MTKPKVIDIIAFILYGINYGILHYDNLEPQGQPYINGCFNWMMNQIFTKEMVVWGFQEVTLLKFNMEPTTLAPGNGDSELGNHHF